MSKLFRQAKDPLSSETHFIGACLSVVGLIFIVMGGIYKDASASIFLGTFIFGISLMALYSASTIYHYVKGSQKVQSILRKLDHSMIYVLIVGTYTPVVLYCMEAPHSYYFLGILWTIAISGIVLKICWLNAPRIVTTLIYLILGWAVVFDFQSFTGLPSGCFLLIALGGIAYSIGAVIYLFKKPNISKRFGFHELFHIFVMIGSFLHYLAIFFYIL